MRGSDLRHAYTPSFELLGFESLIMEQSHLGKITEAVKDCLRCRKFYSAKFIKESEGIPYCSCGGVIKPDVVLYEESLDSKTIEDAVTAITNADTLIIGGTSLVVYPAAGFIDYFRGKHLVLINKAETGRAVRAER